jgi:hypothetical protein
MGKIGIKSIEKEGTRGYPARFLDSTGADLNPSCVASKPELISRM